VRIFPELLVLDIQEERREGMVRGLPWRKERPDPNEARAAERAAAEELRKAHERWPEVTRVAESLAHTSRRNHFSEAMELLASLAARDRQERNHREHPA